VQYLQNNDIGVAGTTVVFTTTLSGTAHSYVYSQGNVTGSNNDLDVLVDLSGVTATSLATTNATTSGLVFISQGNDNMPGTALSDAFNGYGGNDILVGGLGNDTLTGGLGADILTGSAGDDVFVFAAGDTVLGIAGTTKGGINGYDVVTDFSSGNGSTNSEQLDLPGTPALAVNTTATNGVNSTLQVNTNAVVASHQITNGIITFDDTDTFTAPILLTSTADLAAVVQYLQNNDIGNAGTTVAFTGTTIITGNLIIPHTYIYTQGDATGSDNTLDVLVDLIGVNATSLNTTNASTSGLVFIA
jgi:Ca2+-binding RTX toxin-like protein